MAARPSLLHLLIALEILHQARAAETEAPEGKLQLLPSSHECPDSAVPAGANASFYRTCAFSNLYLWRGMAHYVVPDGAEKPALADLGMRFEMWMHLEGPDAVLGFIRPVTVGEFRRMLAEAAAAAGGVAPAKVDAEIPLAYFWKARKVGPASHDLSCDNSPAGRAGKANFYHFFGEWMPALSYTLCEHFGHCSYADRSQLTIIDVNKRWRCHERELHPPFYHAALACLSSQPFRHIAGPSLRDKLTLVRTGWAGLGPRCRGVPPGCYKKGSGRLPPTPELTASWRRIACQCFGLDPESAAPLEPLRLLIVDRLYNSGRHMLNVNTILRELRRRFSSRHVAVELAYMEGLSLAQQAALWGGASVVFHTHGAALANYFFLPRQAVAVQLGPMGDFYDPTLYSGLLTRDLAGVSDVETLEWQNTDPSRAHLITENVVQTARRSFELRRFLDNRELFGEFVATYACPPSMGTEQKTCKRLLFNLNLHVDLPVVFNLTDAAIRRAFEKQGRAAPPDLLAAEGAADEGVEEEAAEEEEEEEEGEGRSSSSGSGGSSSSSRGRGGQDAASLRRLALPQADSLLAQLQFPGGPAALLLGIVLGAAAAATMLSFVRRRT